jgi:hypothetical protein
VSSAAAHGDLSFKDTRAIGKAMVTSVVQDVKHPLRRSGYLVLDGLAAASLGAGTAAKVGAVGRAAGVGDVVRLDEAAARVLPKPAAKVAFPKQVLHPRPADVPKTVPRTPAGPFPKNAALANKVHPVSGIRYDKFGQPIFEGPTVKVGKFTGDRRRDVAAANKKLDNMQPGLSRNGQVWHHRSDGKTMQLVDRETHVQTGHTGGHAIAQQKAAAAAGGGRSDGRSRLGEVGTRACTEAVSARCPEGAGERNCSAEVDTGGAGKPGGDAGASDRRNG